MPETTTEEATNTTENNSEESQRVTEVPIRDVQNVNNLNLGARTIERSRLFVNNISSTIEEMQPLIGQVKRIIKLYDIFFLNFITINYYFND